MPSTQNVTDCLTTIFNCTDLHPRCQNPARFEFISLWNISLRYAAQCPSGPLLFRPAGTTSPISVDHLALTNEACEAIAGASWREYGGDAIWQRLTTWKFPLFQLVANSPRPPLGFWAEAFAFTHLLGDPIGTISDLLRKIDSCQSRAIFWQNCFDGELIELRNTYTPLQQKRLWKALAVIVDSFDEWGLDAGNRAQEYLRNQLIVLYQPDTDPAVREIFVGVCLQTAEALAADRSTKSVPVIIAQAFFIASVVIALIRTKSSSVGPNPLTYIQIEIYSIGFTAQYFWVVFAVCWTSIIGVSQTAAAIPRILRRFKQDLENELGDHGIVPNLPMHVLSIDDLRTYEGGLYSWQPGRPWMPAAHNSSFERPGHGTGTGIIHYALSMLLRVWPVIHFVLPFVIVGTAAATGQLISALVPPLGWSPRSIAMMWMFIAWLCSCLFSFIPFSPHMRSIQFGIIFVKDLLVIGVTFGIIIDTQIGIFNRCNAYTKWGKVGLQLPFMPAVDKVLRSRLVSSYPAVTVVGMAIQLILFPGLLTWRYHAAVQVFLQRDDGISNFQWWYDLVRWVRR